MALSPVMKENYFYREEREKIIFRMRREKVVKRMFGADDE
jgi:hypothetical protein